MSVKIERDRDSIKISQLLLIKIILRALESHGRNVNSKPTPSTHVFHEDEDGIDRKDTWNYRTMIVMLS